VAVLAADVRDVYTDYTRPMCRVVVADVQADVQASIGLKVWKISLHSAVNRDARHC